MISPLRVRARILLSVLFFGALLAIPAPFMTGSWHVRAQQAPTSAQPLTESTAKQSPEEKKSESQEEAFLHSPMVQTFARMLHMDLNSAALLFEIINSAILIFAVAIPLARVLPKVLRKRGETLQSDLVAARKSTEEAGARLKAVEEKLSRLDSEIAAMRTQMEEEGKQEEARIKDALVDETARVVAAAEQEIVSAATMARRGLQQFAADLAIEQAAKQMKLSPDTDKALIAEFVSSASSQGGMN